MAALSLRGQKDIPRFIVAFTGSQRYIMDYLIEEVLQKQSPEIRDFLMKTSILERLIGPLCNALVEREDSQKILLKLERSHLFVVPLDESRQFYRYEHLFADLLQRECETVYGIEQVIALHQKASKWYQDNNLPDEAINHALAAREWETAIKLITARYEEHRKRGEYETLIGWLQAIPEETLRVQFRLYTQYTFLLARTGRLGVAEVALNYLETAVQDDTALQGEIAFLWGMVYQRRGDMKLYLELSEKAFALLPQDNTAMRCRAAANIAHALQRSSNFKEAEKWATMACELGQQAGDFIVVTRGWGQLGIVYTYQGKLTYAVKAFMRSNDFAEQYGLAFGNFGMLCWVHYILNDLEAAAENARLAIELEEADLTALFYQAQICLVQGNAADADAMMEKLDEASHKPTIDSHWYTNYIGFHVMYAIQRDNVEEATRWGEQLPDLAEMMLVVRPFVPRLLLAQDNKKAAAKLLHELYESAIQLGATLIVIQIHIYQALAADNEESALSFLAEALTMAEPEGVIRFFVDEGKMLKPLMKKALILGITPGFTKKLLNIIEVEEQQRLHKGKEGTISPIQELLSKRELEVLGFLVEGFSNRQIADRLIISQGTVKTHVHNIFEKLNAQSRTQVVSRARELKLI